MKNILIFLLITFIPLNCFPQNIDKFIEYKKEYIILDSLISHKEFKIAFDIIKKRKFTEVPKDFLRGYYSFLGEYYLNIGDLNKSVENARQVILHGANNSYIELLKLRYGSTHKEYINEIESSYPNWEREYLSKINLSEKKIVNEMYSSDQDIRRTYYSYIPSANKKQKDSILELMAKIDARNIRIYDSISSLKGWIYKDSIGNETKNYHVILAHNDDSIRYKYIYKGFELAKKGLIEWNELIGIQVMGFRKSDMKNNIHFQKNFKVEKVESLKSDFTRFLCYCLFIDLTAPGNRSKDIKLYINCKDKKSKPLNTLKKLKQVLVNFGVKPDSILIDEGNYTTNDPDINDFIIGIEYL